MKVQVESISPVKKKLMISVPEAEVLAAIEETYRKVGGQVRIPGFRPGKAPRALLEQRYGSQVEAEVYETLVKKTMVEALENEKLDAVAMPEITEPKRAKGEGFTYQASVEVKPLLDPKNYKGISVEQKEIKVTKEQIEEVLQRLQDQQSVLKDREGATTPVKGDHVVIAIQGIDAEGNPTSKEGPREQIYEIEGGILQKDVEKAVKKIRVGESTPVTVKAETSGKKEDQVEMKEFHVRVTLNAIKEKVLPALDDEFAKSVGPFEDMKALRERVEKDLTEESESKTKSETLQKLMEKVLKENPCELPHALVESETHSMIHNFWQQLERAGMRELPPEYSEEKLHEKMEPDAKRHVHEQLLIEAIAKKENLAVDEEEVTSRLQELAKASKVPYGEFRAYYEKTNRLDSLRFHLLAQKTLDFLHTNAKIK